jgi:hypothetical protein
MLRTAFESAVHSLINVTEAWGAQPPHGAKNIPAAKDGLGGAFDHTTKFLQLREHYATPLNFADALMMNTNLQNPFSDIIHAAVPWSLLLRDKVFNNADDKALVGLFSTSPYMDKTLAANCRLPEFKGIRARLKRFLHVARAATSTRVEKKALRTWPVPHVWLLVQHVYGPENTRALLDPDRLAFALATSKWSHRDSDGRIAHLFFASNLRIATRAELIYCAVPLLEHLCGAVAHSFLSGSDFIDTCNTPVAETYLLRPLQRLLTYSVRPYLEQLGETLNTTLLVRPLTRLRDVAAAFLDMPAIALSRDRHLFAEFVAHHLESIRECDPNADFVGLADDNSDDGGRPSVRKRRRDPGFFSDSEEPGLFSLSMEAPRQYPISNSSYNRQNPSPGRNIFNNSPQSGGMVFGTVPPVSNEDEKNEKNEDNEDDIWAGFD